jgi:hypothetical protein
MGCYVNPRDMSKEEWLLKHGRQVPLSECQVSTDEIPVCLVDNGAFSAAGVAFDQAELNAFSSPDGRLKYWFMVPRAALYGDSDLAHYEKGSK